ncbi:MAG: hypothetical protein HZB75_04770 [Candidatus Saccharibacteria bacterium]|nr:MAG: hypothetical protein HZB75_04770 [Candidatus Saccharibacteria bacterium]
MAGKPRGIDLYYHTEGDGTAESPAVVGFTFLNALAAPSIEALRRQLPSSVVLEPRESSGSFKITGANPAMTRGEITSIYYKLVQDNRWISTHQG